MDSGLKNSVNQAPEPSLLETQAQTGVFAYGQYGSLSGAKPEDAKMAKELEQILQTLQQRYMRVFPSLF